NNHHNDDIRTSRKAVRSGRSHSDRWSGLLLYAAITVNMTGAANRDAVPARLHLRGTPADQHHDGDNPGSGFVFFRHAHPFPSPPMSPSARSVSPRSPRLPDFAAVGNGDDVSEDIAA
ncbi:hypothetical protein BVRB_030100, partial [Beta vulgaris subsp. vulgaris]